jgi:transcriptional regulator with XRE-family HTH domain
MKPIPNSVWLNLGQRIVDLRRLKGISQLRLAEMADISKEHLSNLERGNKLPGAKTLAQIERALDV